MGVEKMTRSEQARQNFLSGYNCAQAVVLAFSDLLGVPEDTLKAAVLPLGGGLARLRETCGTVSGGAVCLGLLFPEKGKAEIYALVRELAQRFREENGSYNCGELLSRAGVAAERGGDPQERTADYYKKRPCPELAARAAAIVEDIYLKNK